jgi:uncharacterized protein (DUF302 family)
MTTATTYGLNITLDRPFDATVEATRAALAAEGFGVLMEADLRATFRKKLNVDTPPYVILGACSPPHALEALKADPDLGLLLPCNVIVRRDEAAGRTRVAAIDPVVVLGVAANPALHPVALVIRERLVRALAALEKAP